MDYSIQLTEAPKIIRVTVTGNWEPEADKAMALDIMKTVNESKVGKVLVDMRGLDFILPVIDIFDRAKELSEQRRGFQSHSSKVAILYQPSSTSVNENFTFFENTSQNRGLPYRVFTQLEDALEWLAE